MEPSDIRNRFTYHPPDEAKVAKHSAIRSMCMNLAHNLNDMLPEGREKSIAIKALEDTMMWANAALARKSEGTQPC